jgi:polysaccharide deacetylase family protein (PEP-CTERM system associated)
MPAFDTEIVNAFTVDLEDWTQSVLGPTAPITERVLANTDCTLELLARFRVRATFFALGKVCEKFPQLLPRIAAAGHEIASHGYGHELLHDLTPEDFREDIARSIDVIESQTGRRPIGYRAPAFSITTRTRWAGPILAESGFQYSSSIFPFAGRRYGIADAPRFPHRWATCHLTEFPLTTVRIIGRNFPVAGGGYLRLLPAAVVAAAIRRVHREGQPTVLYMHPYELAPDEIRDLRRSGWRIAWRTQLTQSIFRSRMVKRLDYLLKRFRFVPMAEVLKSYTAAKNHHEPEMITEKTVPVATLLPDTERRILEPRVHTATTITPIAGQRSSACST